jgi:hypothetical protein
MYLAARVFETPGLHAWAEANPIKEKFDLKNTSTRGLRNSFYALRIRIISYGF